MKLYPPYIDGKLPAFIYVEGSTEIAIPFQLNPLVGEDDFDSMKLVIRSMSGIQVGEEHETTNFIYDEIRGIATFSKIPDIFNIGQFYKIQIAFVENGQLGYYSSVGIIKCIDKPTLLIENLDSNNVTSNIVTFTGNYTYSCATDKEKIYSYKYDVYNEQQELYDTSGELIYNAEKDDNKTIWTLNKALKENEIYSIQETIVTQNLYTLQTQKYLIMDGLYEPKGDLWQSFIFSVELDIKNGRNIIKVFSTKNVNGRYKIVRSSSEDNFVDWIDLTDFTVSNQLINENQIIVKDYIIKSGIRYKYALQKYNLNGLRSERFWEIKTEPIAFEDMFLFDGEKQLRIAFNPKVSSFKTSLQETKSDTIGGPYPFFYRNGNIAYKEFPISGLISIHTDDNFEFFGEKKVNQLLNLEDGFSNPKRPELSYNPAGLTSINTSLTIENITIEREFKTMVLDWLNNGKPKLFRSPTEGNFLIRLMNISLSPNDTLGRMLHTFSATGYEIGKSDVRSLLKEKNFKQKQYNLNIVEEDFKLLTEEETSLSGKFLEIEVMNSQSPEVFSVEDLNSTLILPKIASARYSKWENNLDGNSFKIQINEEEKNYSYYKCIKEQAVVADSFENKKPYKLSYCSKISTEYTNSAWQQAAGDNAYIVYGIYVTTQNPTINEGKYLGNVTIITPSKVILVENNAYIFLNEKVRDCTICGDGLITECYYYKKESVS